MVMKWTRVGTLGEEAWLSGPWRVYVSGRSGRLLWYIEHTKDGVPADVMIRGGRNVTLRRAWFRSFGSARARVEALEADRDAKIMVGVGVNGNRWEQRKVGAPELKCDGHGHHEGPVRDYGPVKGCWCDYHAAPNHNPHESNR